MKQISPFCQAQPQLNSTQIKAYAIFILRQIQPTTQPPRIVVKGDLNGYINYQFQLNQWLS